MTTKEIIALSTADRLALSARALAGGEGDVRDYLLSCAWLALDKRRDLSKRAKVAALSELYRSVRVVVER